MTKKRFRVVNHDEYDYELDYITDNNKRMHIEDVCDLLNNLVDENEQLTKLLILIADADSVRSENSVKEILRNTLFGLDTVAGESYNAFKEYSILNKFFKEHYKEHWDNDKYD